MHKFLDKTPHSQQQVILEDEHGTWTKHLLQQASNELSGVFEELEGECVAFQMDNSAAWIAVDFALNDSNKIALPLPLFFTRAQCEHALLESGASWLLSETLNSDNVLSKTINVCGRTVYVYQLSSKPAAYFAGTRKITFTSGSTGTPKGVCLSDLTMQQVASSLCERLVLENPKHLCLLPLAVLLENVAGVYAPLLSGGQVITPSLNTLGYLGSQLQDPEKILMCISQFEPHTLILVPELLQLLVAACSAGWQAPESLVFIAVGGARVDESLLVKARNSGLPVFQGYGLSEAGSVVALSKVAPLSEGVGDVLPHLKYKIEQGQLFLRGPLYLGYLNGPEHSPEHWLATGDLIRQTESGLDIYGRLKNQLILSSGRNVSPEWPEALLLSQPGVAQVVVFGDAKTHLVALIYAASQLSDDQLEQHISLINSQLPDYARIGTWHRLAQPLSTSNELLTSNGRPKRDVIARYYRTELTALYCDNAELQA
ncbi:AMP-binding protein [Pseudoalteromonas sp. PPB1]|uniref:AMP-binding protein n=1 Tax=Pseudoalteromonas sp. PPB1 TaxID=2756136 RepID=UPI001891822B|nr:AMP-binding protein [Pseudoalteromonas sp. PPB1]